MSKVETQAEKLGYVAEAGVVHSFDLCIAALRDAKEELADRSRQAKIVGGVDGSQFVLLRGNPFYTSRVALDRLVAYAKHVIESGDDPAAGTRFDRCAYHTFVCSPPGLMTLRHTASWSRCCRHFFSWALPGHWRRTHRFLRWDGVAT